jgi:hypothetical protein
MNTEQWIWTSGNGWNRLSHSLIDQPQLVLLFGGTAQILNDRARAELKKKFPDALTIGCTTAGEIAGSRIMDDSLVATAIRFHATNADGLAVRLSNDDDGYAAGKKITHALGRTGLTHILVFSDGQRVNGSALVRGLRESLPTTVGITGGLAGDGVRFQETRIVWGNGVQRDAVVAVGLYSTRLLVGIGSMGGWEPDGAEMHITRSNNNVLFELDGMPALSVYKSWLGGKALDLPASALLYPLSIRLPGKQTSVVRTILNIDEIAQSLTFAGDVPEGMMARCMSATSDKLIDAAASAARVSAIPLNSYPAQLALIISCVGRRMVLKDRSVEEVQIAQRIFGLNVPVAGFYSYGEISPFANGLTCDLLNQTISITSFTEL